MSRKWPFYGHNIKKEKQLLTLFFFMSNYLIIVHTFVTLKTRLNVNLYLGQYLGQILTEPTGDISRYHSRYTSCLFLCYFWVSSTQPPFNLPTTIIPNQTTQKIQDNITNGKCAQIKDKLNRFNS